MRRLIIILETSEVKWNVGETSEEKANVDINDTTWNLKGHEIHTFVESELY